MLRTALKAFAYLVTMPIAGIGIGYLVGEGSCEENGEILSCLGDDVFGAIIGGFVGIIAGLGLAIATIVRYWLRRRRERVWPRGRHRALT
jgi:hypothetical protein